MNHTIRNLALAATAIFAATPVLADELLPAGHYEDELARCVAEIRAELNVAEDEVLQHRVIEIDKKNVWYEFVIETADDTAIAATTCRAWRFDDRTIADVTPADTAAAQVAVIR